MPEQKQFCSIDAADWREAYVDNSRCDGSGASLYLQMHHHRTEHWIVVSGVAQVTEGDDQFLLLENESTFIRIGNPLSSEPGSDSFGGD